MNQYYIGIDLNDRTAMISYYQQGMADPETVSTIAGSESFQIPVLMAKRGDQDEWVYGDDAKRLAKNNEAVCADALLSRALSKEQIVAGDIRYSAEEILALFLRKLIALPQMLRRVSSECKLVISVAKVSDPHRELFYRILPMLGIRKEDFSLIDHRTAFYYFALNQQEVLWMHDVYLFECVNHSIRYIELKRDVHKKPQLVSIQESRRYALSEQPDMEFLNLLKEVCEGKNISTVYLVGDGFDGGWMNLSLKYMCRGRRAFIGKNLFSKGACYSAVVTWGQKKWPFVYIGENDMKFNLSIRISQNGRSVFYTLINAGKQWYQMKKECQVILSGGNELEVWKQMPHMKEADVETLELTDMTNRRDRLSRLQLTAVPLSDTRVDLEIRDLGFGEFFRSTGKTWHYTISV